MSTSVRTVRSDNELCYGGGLSDAWRRSIVKSPPTR